MEWKQTNDANKNEIYSYDMIWLMNVDRSAHTCSPAKKALRKCVFYLRKRFLFALGHSHLSLKSFYSAAYTYFAQFIWFIVSHRGMRSILKFLDVFAARIPDAKAITFVWFASAFFLFSHKQKMFPCGLLLLGRSTATRTDSTVDRLGSARRSCRWNSGGNSSARFR